jgi:hypothetical protein
MQSVDDPMQFVGDMSRVADDRSSPRRLDFLRRRPVAAAGVAARRNGARVHGDRGGDPAGELAMHLATSPIRGAEPQVTGAGSAICADSCRVSCADRRIPRADSPLGERSAAAAIPQRVLAIAFRCREGNDRLLR